MFLQPDLVLSWLRGNATSAGGDVTRQLL